MALYQGRTVIQAELERIVPGTGSVPLELRLQACSDRVCLPPETLRLDAALR